MPSLLRGHVGFTSMPFRVRFEWPSNGFDVNPCSLFFHFDVTAVSLRCYFDLTLISVPFDLDSFRYMFHIRLIGKTHGGDSGGDPGGSGGRGRAAGDGRHTGVSLGTHRDEGIGGVRSL